MSSFDEFLSSISEQDKEKMAAYINRYLNEIYPTERESQFAKAMGSGILVAAREFLRLYHNWLEEQER